MDNVPDNWTKRAYPSLLPLGQWFVDFMMRLKELESWASDFAVKIYLFHSQRSLNVHNAFPIF